jgi:hypothetical protein
MKFGQTPMPDTPDGWLSEIAQAYCDAREAIPFGVFTGESISEKELFHIAPQICLKTRGIERTAENIGRATEAMLASYVATKDSVKGVFGNPHLAFAFAYMASHYGMKLLTEEKVSETMQFLDLRRIEFVKTINRKVRKTAGKTARLAEMFHRLTEK